MNARETLLDVARREGWMVLHDLGLYVELLKPNRRIAIGFDQAGRCMWCTGQKPRHSAMSSALELLVAQA